MNTMAVMEQFSLQPPLSSTLEDPCPPVSFSTPGNPALSSAARVETVSGWRKQARAEEDAGIASDPYAVLVRLFRCDLCQICIGRNYYEQELYLYPVYQQKERIGDDPSYYATARFLHICGGCAHRRYLPSALCMIEPAHYTTTLLLIKEGETVREVDPSSTAEKMRIRRALSARIAAYHSAYNPQALWQMLRDGLTLLPLPITPLPVAPRAPKTPTPSPSSPSLFSSPLRSVFSSFDPKEKRRREMHQTHTPHIAAAQTTNTPQERRRIAL